MKPEATTARPLFTPEGWITRTGRFIWADIDFPHSAAAMVALGGDEGTAELRAERMGWLRISDYGDRCSKPLNQAQLNTFFDWCQVMRVDYDEAVSGITSA